MESLLFQALTSAFLGIRGLKGDIRICILRWAAVVCSEICDCGAFLLKPSNLAEKIHAVQTSLKVQAPAVPFMNSAMVFVCFLLWC